MAFTPVKTVSTGQTWGARDWNTYIRDNFAAGVPDAMTTKGDMLVGAGADACSRLGVGANYKMLWADNSQTVGITWANISGLCVRGNASYMILNAVWKTITIYTDEVFDRDSNFGSNRFTAAQPGYYLVSAHTYNYLWGPEELTEGLQFALAIYKNNAIYSVFAASNLCNTTEVNRFMCGMDLVYLGVGEYIELFAYNPPALGGSCRLTGDNLYARAFVVPII